jgi:outer membrane protein TolC
MRRTGVLTAFAVSATLTWSSALHAQVQAQPRQPAQPVTAAQAPPLPPRVGVAGAPPLSLTLADAVRLAVERNNDVTIAREETQAARQSVRAAEGVFDPLFVPSVSYQRAVSPSASALGGGTAGRLEQDQFGGSLEFSGRSPWAGGRYTANFTSNRLQSSNQFARLNPQYPSSFGVTFVQPIFRGREIDTERRQILLARETAELTDAQLRRVLMDQLTLVEQAYWDLVFATRNVQLQSSAVDQARAQVASNERQAQAGTLAPIDVVEAQTQVANFQLSAASAQQALTEAENRLKRLMLGGPQAAEWNRAIVPSDLSDRFASPFTLDDARRIALARRPELTELETARAQNEIDRRFFRDEARPQVDLVGNYSLAGLSGAALVSQSDPLGGSDAALLARLNELSLRAGLDPLVTTPSSGGGTSVPSFLTGGYEQSIGNIFARRFPTALVQLQLGIPLRNQTAEANVARTEILTRRIDVQRAQLEQTIEAEVRNALEAAQTSEARLGAAAAAQRNAQEQYESEQRRFEAGLSTVFLVLQRQTALVSAQSQELRARADLNQAMALLDRATGTTLEHHGVALKKP